MACSRACSHLLINVSSLGKLKGDTKFPPAFRVVTRIIGFASGNATCARHAAQSKVMLTLK
jgi:hypothetical protein